MTKKVGTGGQSAFEVAAGWPATFDQAGFEDVGLTYEAVPCMDAMPSLANEWNRISRSCVQDGQDYVGNGQETARDITFSIQDEDGNAALGIFQTAEAAIQSRDYEAQKISLKRTDATGNIEYRAAIMRGYNTGELGGEFHVVEITAAVQNYLVKVAAA